MCQRVVCAVDKLKAMMLKFISWCTLDINISIDNCSLFKLHQSQIFAKDVWSTF